MVRSQAQRHRHVAHLKRRHVVQKAQLKHLHQQPEVQKQQNHDFPQQKQEQAVQEQQNYVVNQKIKTSQTTRGFYF